MGINKFWKKEVKYVGRISNKSGNTDLGFSKWLVKQTEKFAGENVEVVIKTTKFQGELTEQKESFVGINKLQLV